MDVFFKYPDWWSPSRPTDGNVSRPGNASAPRSALEHDGTYIAADRRDLAPVNAGRYELPLR